MCLCLESVLFLTDYDVQLVGRDDDDDSGRPLSSSPTAAPSNNESAFLPSSPPPISPQVLKHEWTNNRAGRQQATKELMGPPYIQGTESEGTAEDIYPRALSGRGNFFRRRCHQSRANAGRARMAKGGRERGRDENRETTLFIPNFSRFWKLGGPLDAFN